MAEKSGVTFGELYKAKSITDADLQAAVDAYFADLTTSVFVMGEGHGVDLAAAVTASLFATEMAADPERKLASRRAAVRSAILLARPVKG